MLESLLSWWIARLAELLPARLRGNPGLPPDGLILRVDAAGRVTRSRRIGGVVTPLADNARIPGGVPQTLAVPEGFLLERRVELPLAVARDAAGVVALDFDRLTPFSADATIWGIDRVGDDKARGVAYFSLGMVPKALIEPWLAVLRNQGLHPSRLECARAGGVRVLSIGGRARQDRGGALIAAGLALLAVAAVALPFVRQQIALDRIQSRIDAVRDQAAMSGRLLQRLSPTQNSGDRLIAARAETPLALQTLAGVTAALPDDTYLVSMSLEDGRLSLEGTSSGAARLIGMLAAQNPIRDPSFSSPVTRTSDGKDAFTISATVAGAPVAAPTDNGAAP